MTTRTGPTPRTGAGTRRAQLTAIAGALFARDGYHNVTVGDIAAAAGLSGPAIYRHFPGKQAILAEVVRSGFDEMARAVAADLAATSDPAERLRTTYRDLAAFVIRRPDFGVMWRREYRHLAPADAAELAKRMGEASAAAVAEIRRLRPDLPPEDAELLSWAALSVLGSISDHRVRLPRAAFEELLAGMAMGVARARLDDEAVDNRPQERAVEDQNQKPELQTENRREQLLKAAARLFWDRGYHAVTLEEIGAAAGIAGPSIYSHFAGKTDLLRTITERIGERLRLTMTTEPPGAEWSADLSISQPHGADRTAVLTARPTRESATVGVTGLAMDCAIDPAADSPRDPAAAAVSVAVTHPAADSAAALVTDSTADSGTKSATDPATGSAANPATTSATDPAEALAANLAASPASGSANLAANLATASAFHPASDSALAPAAARAALSDLAARYVTTVLSSRDLVAAYFTEGHNLPDRDRAETRRFQRAYTAHWAALLSAACPGASSEEVRIRVLAAFAVVNDTARTRRLMDRPGLAGQLRQLVLAVLLTPCS